MSHEEGSGLSDASLLARSREGDSAAFDEVIRRHQDRVMRFVTILGIHGADAEDVAQDAFIAAWRGASGYEGRGSVRSWLLTITRRAAAHHLRRRVGEPRALESLEELALRAGWGEPAAAEPEDPDDRGALVRRALARLPAEERELLILRDAEGLSGEEAAAALGVSVAAMKSRLHRARLRLAVLAREEAHGVA